jgi:hypothetical protein
MNPPQTPTGSHGLLNLLLLLRVSLVYFLVWSFHSILRVNLLHAALERGLPLARDIQIHRLDCVDHRLPALPQWENAHARRAEEEPQDANRYPALRIR